ncbi:hypothetical protein EUB48_12415 [Rhodoferax sediminis]|uniref:Uncharacterized protein n=1 Tax=Rhodoferax sediminis TaxID=2509614 RepID=A0A515DC53_9BURK|nr:hypothetical protein [Rhodoferax sediminis]QDL37992.1 hypothetical protein EUB48_12415 [Rhodoferax sediminis]
MNLILTGFVVAAVGAAPLLQPLQPEPQPPFCCAQPCSRRDERKWGDMAIKAVAKRRFKLAGAKVHAA